jgi:uncharacterized protein YdiU (UPF0061 family)
MRAVNPAVIPRNHRVEEALSAAEDHDDLSALHRLRAALASPYEAGADMVRLEWAVLNWNEPAIRFYRSLGAVPMDEWSVYRLAGEALAAAAADGGG